MGRGAGAVVLFIGALMTAGCSDTSDGVLTADTTAPAGVTSTLPSTTIDPSIGFDDADWYEVTATSSFNGDPDATGCELVNGGLWEEWMRVGVQPEQGWAWIDSRASDVAPERFTDGTSTWVYADAAWEDEEVDADWVAVDEDNDPSELVSILDISFGELTPGLYLEEFLNSTPAEFWEQTKSEATTVESVGSEEFEGVPVERFVVTLDEGETLEALIDDSGAPRVFESAIEDSPGVEGSSYRMEIRPGVGPFTPAPPLDARGLTEVPEPQPKLTVECDVAQYLADRSANVATTIDMSQ